MNDLNLRVAAMLRAARLDAGITQATLAKRLGHTAHSNIAHIERGAKNITIDTLSRMAVALGKNVRIELTDED